jgi:hypothetical protein
MKQLERDSDQINLPNLRLTTHRNKKDLRQRITTFSRPEVQER